MTNLAQRSRPRPKVRPRWPPGNPVRPRAGLPGVRASRARPCCWVFQTPPPRPTVLHPSDLGSGLLRSPDSRCLSGLSCPWKVGVIHRPVLRDHRGEGAFHSHFLPLLTGRTPTLGSKEDSESHWKVTLKLKNVYDCTTGFVPGTYFVPAFIF